MSSFNNNCALGLVPLMSSRCLQATKHTFTCYLKRSLQLMCRLSYVFTFMDSFLMKLNALSQTNMCAVQTSTDVPLKVWRFFATLSQQFLWSENNCAILLEALDWSIVYSNHTIKINWPISHLCENTAFKFSFWEISLSDVKKLLK